MLCVRDILDSIIMNMLNKKANKVLQDLEEVKVHLELSNNHEAVDVAEDYSFHSEVLMDEAEHVYSGPVVLAANHINQLNNIISNDDDDEAIDEEPWPETITADRPFINIPPDHRFINVTPESAAKSAYPTSFSAASSSLSNGGLVCSFRAGAVRTAVPSSSHRLSPHVHRQRTESLHSSFWDTVSSFRDTVSSFWDTVSSFRDTISSFLLRATNDVATKVVAVPECCRELLWRWWWQWYRWWRKRDALQFPVMYASHLSARLISVVVPGLGCLLKSPLQLSPLQLSIPPATSTQDTATTVSQITKKRFKSLGRGAGRTLLTQLRYKISKKERPGHPASLLLIILLLAMCVPQVSSAGESNGFGECSHVGLHTTNHSLDFLAKHRLQPGDDIVLPARPLPPAIDASMPANLDNLTTLDGICAAPQSPPSRTAITTTCYRNLKPRLPAAAQECRHLSFAHRTEIYTSDVDSEIEGDASVVGAISRLFPFPLLSHAVVYSLVAVVFLLVWHLIKIRYPLDDGWGDLRACVVPNQPALPPPLPGGACYVHHPPPRLPPLELELHYHDHDDDNLSNFGDAGGDGGGFESSFSPQHPSENLEGASPEVFPKKSALVLGRRLKLLLHDEADQLLPGNLSSKLPENVIVPSHTSGKELLATAGVPFYSEEEEEEEEEAEQCLHHQYRLSEEDEDIQPMPPAKISKDGHLGTTGISKVDAGYKHLDLFHVPNPPPNASLISIPPLPPSNGNLGASFLDENGLRVNYCMGGPPCFVMADDIEFLPPLPPTPSPPPSPPPPPLGEDSEEFECCFDHPVIKLFLTPSGPAF